MSLKTWKIHCIRFFSPLSINSAFRGSELTQLKLLLEIKHKTYNFIASKFPKCHILKSGLTVLPKDLYYRHCEGQAPLFCDLQNWRTCDKITHGREPALPLLYAWHICSSFQQTFTERAYLYSIYTAYHKEVPPWCSINIIFWRLQYMQTSRTYPHEATRGNNDESSEANIPPISTTLRLTGKMFIKVTLASANQASFTPTCPGQQPKSKLKRQNFKWKKHVFGYKTNHSFVTLNKLLVLQRLFP